MCVYIYRIYIYILYHWKSLLKQVIFQITPICPQKGRPGISWGKSSSSKPGRSPVGSIFWVVDLALKNPAANTCGCSTFFSENVKKRGQILQPRIFWGQYFFVSWVRSFSTHFFLGREKFGTSDKPSPRLQAHKPTRITLPKTKLTASFV